MNYQGNYRSVYQIVYFKVSIDGPLLFWSFEFQVIGNNDGCASLEVYVVCIIHDMISPLI